MNKLTDNVVKRMRDCALAGEPKSDDEVKAINQFCDGVLPGVLEAYGADDEPAINEAFNDYTDSLCKDGDISDETYNNITFDFEGWDA